MNRDPVGSKKPTPDQRTTVPLDRDDEIRVQRSAVANLKQFQPGVSSFCYWWYLKWTRWSRTYNSKEQAIAAMRQQGFGAYLDLDGTLMRLQ